MYKLPSGRAGPKDNDEEEMEEDICFTFSLAGPVPSRATGHGRTHGRKGSPDELYLPNARAQKERKTNGPAALRYIISRTNPVPLRQ